MEERGDAAEAQEERISILAQNLEILHEAEFDRTLGERDRSENEESG